MKLYLVLGLRRVAFVLCALCGSTFAYGAGKPNIVVIVTDDAAYSDFGFSASLTNQTNQIETPNLDALAQQSVIGSSYYTAHSLCSPTRAGLLTGVYSQRFGYENNLANSFAAAGTRGLPADQLTIAQRLQPLGYTSGMVGKWHVGFTDGLNRPLDKGFDEFYGFLGGGRTYWEHNSLEQGIWKNNQFHEAQYRVEGDQSRYDPVQGRYLTDAFGEEAASFVNRHADDENPFFLYMALTGPHEPWQAKKSDLDHFAHITDPNRRLIAAMTYAVDRAVGDVLGALEANGIDDNTIVVFTNDNGAVSYIGNPPFRGHKGTSYEGGIRVPFLIKAPDLQPGVYDSPLTALDLLPTFVAAGGGDITQFAHDGYDVMPYLTGEETDDPNKVRFWRNFDSFAVRKGDWKLTRVAVGYLPGPFLHNIKNDPNESVFLHAQHPEKVAELARELTYWEAQLAKPKWGDIGALNQNTFDHFVFRNDLAATTNWSTASAWRQGGTSNNKTMLPADAYANGVFEFGVRNDADYTATNDMKRMTRETFMLNRLRLTGSFGGGANRQGTINGNAVLFVQSLAGELPQIELAATSSVTPAGFTFQIGNELQLLHDLEITGNGTQQFVINGAIRDYYEPLQPNVTTPHSVRKTGSSWVTLKGNNTFAGSLTVEQGKVTVSGPSAAISGAQGIEIGSAGNVTLESGTIAVNWIDNSAGGSFNFNGGLLKVVNVSGNLTNSGGTYSPGASPALSTVSGNLTQNAGTFLIELGGTAAGSQFDLVAVGGTATIGSTLDVDLVNGFIPGRGQTFQFLMAAGGIGGMFASTAFPTLPAGLTWNLIYNTNVTALVIGGVGGIGGHLPGDYNLDGNVDAADYTVWRDALGSGNLAADGNSDGFVTITDHQIWKSAFGLTLNGGGFAAIGGAVPEPTALALALFAATVGLFARRLR